MKKNLLFFAFFLVFLLLTVNSYLASKPQKKNEIYNQIKKYSPYYLEKRFGGLEIKSKFDKKFHEKPSNMEVFHRFEQLEKKWGKKNLEIKNKTLYVYDKNHKIIKQFKNLSYEKLNFLHTYYGI